MGQILSSQTVYSVAYLTEKGRELLFNENNTRFTTDAISGGQLDLFEIVSFSLSDPDMNYKLTDGYRLESGEVPDLTGKNESCIKSTLNFEEKNQIIVDNSVPSNYGVIYSYSTNLPSDEMVININDKTISDPSALDGSSS